MYDYLLIKLNFDLPDFCHYTIFTGAILVCYYFVAITYVVMLHFTDFVIVLVYRTKVNRCSVVVQRMPAQFLTEAHCVLMIISLHFSV